MGLDVVRGRNDDVGGVAATQRRERRGVLDAG
jgi:hypothetical protein